MCAYCGVNPATTADHAVSRLLFPKRASSRYPRITVPACGDCNSGWSDDEPHFRNVLLLAGAPTTAVQELWDGKARRGFCQVDGRRRAQDIAALLEPVTTAAGQRHMIYPAKDDRVLRIIRKTVRGLCHHHGLGTAIPETRVIADVSRFSMPETWLAEMNLGIVDPDVLDYRYAAIEQDGIHSFWLLTYYGRTPFVAIVEVAGAAEAA
jgi:hypothetical protein